ncbi:DNA (cytosine-5-)-methyltransferase [Moorena sp. SIO3I8]|uniref:DNA cytosine methyltransferase n=1 Tax=Moorena sp. SIO3I8 TaxID=2607833 RepID=UPI0013C1CC8A|nr:DNA (cytosine-5-)-methyltransferase [Moorena sp. SIO3I8]NEO06945.1 DNA cytosine methyltransferase [Moorena sp. SIO3I8]
MELSFTSLFSGAGGLDLGFEMAGFKHLYSTDIDRWSVKTLRNNRPEWDVEEADIRELSERDLPDSDVILAGVPCQGFSLGGNRKENDERNFLFQEVVRMAKIKKPRFIVIENVLNLRTMKEPKSGKPFVDVISEHFKSLGYYIKYNVFRVSGFGVPQTRRRFIFIASFDRFPSAFHWPTPEPDTPASAYLADLAANPFISLPNHCPEWGFKSRVHEETGKEFDPTETPVPCRFSRTGSDGHPIRSLDAPFPAIDTGTIWGWAQGNVVAERKEKDRVNGQFVRNPNINLKLWRISASRLRRFTNREYARLQTFPDSWVFHGGNKRHVHQQIGNAVPVQFAYRVACFIQAVYQAQCLGQPMNLFTNNTVLQLELNL